MLEYYEELARVGILEKILERGMAALEEIRAKVLSHWEGTLKEETPWSPLFSHEYEDYWAARNWDVYILGRAAQLAEALSGR